MGPSGAGRGACVCLAAATLITSEAPTVGKIRLGDPTTTWHLQVAVNTAHEWLGDAQCQRLFSDFRDVRGRLLSEVLADRGESGQSHLERLFFYDGARTKACEGRGAVALTMPGSYVIHVCPVAFGRLARERRPAVVVVVHEVLHTLGLGENPPSPSEINSAVLRRCGH